MRYRDLGSFSLAAIRGHRLRSSLSVLGIAIGIAAVILLTSIGEGTRRYVLEQFTQFGTNLLTINPGKTKTTGIPGILGGTTRKLTIEDAVALERVPGVEISAPHTHGQAQVERGVLGRSVYVFGATAELPRIMKFGVQRGQFLPPGDPRRGSPVAVLGPRLARELFGEEEALGEHVRIGSQRFRVIGVMEEKGQMLGVDMDDAAYVPLATHMQVFNLDEVQEITVVFSPSRPTDSVVEGVRRILAERHRGTEDFTITTQAAMLETFGKVMSAITMSVGAIAGISLLVGAIGILSMMWIAVGERTGEIGLVRAIGGTASQIQAIFLHEALVLAAIGGAVGVAVGLGLAAFLRVLRPGMPVHTPLRYLATAIAISVVAGLASGVFPARRAARLDPIEALRAE